MINMFAYLIGLSMRKKHECPDGTKLKQIPKRSCKSFAYLFYGKRKESMPILTNQV